MTHVFGWWLTSPDRLTQVNQFTGQRLRLTEPFRPRSGRADESELRFVYEDDEIDYPIVARWRSEPSSSAGPKKNLAARYSLHVDHVRSAALWQQSMGTASAYPSYGLWRRVDDCLTDALTCSLGIFLPGHEVSKLTVCGGWSNGTWQSGLSRDFRLLTESDRAAAERSNAPISDRPSLAPISMLPHSQWRFHGFPSTDSMADGRPGHISTLVRLSGLKKTNEFRLPAPVWVVPTGSPLVGLEGRTAYLASEDGQRVLYPQEGTDSSGRERGPSTFIIEYVDEDFSARFQGVNTELTSHTNWNFRIASLFGAHRGEDAEDDLWIRTGSSGNMPSYSLWRRLASAIQDAWLCWRGTDARNPHWADDLTLAAASSVTVKGLYLGGHWLSNECCRARIDNVIKK